MGILKTRLDAGYEWNKARRKVFWTRLLNTFSSTPDRLLNFEEIANRLQLRNAVYRGSQIIELDKITGSVGRYQDFTRTFLPYSAGMENRWVGVAAAYLNETGVGVPPIEVFKVGDTYFVKDGNHRVSVCRQLDIPDIEAFVWEYPPPVDGIDPDSDIDTLLLAGERQHFFDDTNLDTLRPNNNIELTVPGGYSDLLWQIENYQNVLRKIDEADIPYDEAVTAWYDMLYETTVQKIRAEGVMDLFEDRTEADFYVWITRHHQALKSQYEGRVMLSQTVKDFWEQNRPTPFRRIAKIFRRLFFLQDDPNL